MALAVDALHCTPVPTHSIHIVVGESSLEKEVKVVNVHTIQIDEAGEVLMRFSEGVWSVNAQWTKPWHHRIKCIFYTDYVGLVGRFSVVDVMWTGRFVRHSILTTPNLVRSFVVVLQPLYNSTIRSFYKEIILLVKCVWFSLHRCVVLCVLDFITPAPGSIRGQLTS